MVGAENTVDPDIRPLPAAMGRKLLGLPVKFPTLMGAHRNDGIGFGPGLIEHRAEHRRGGCIQSQRIPDRRVPNWLKIEDAADGHAAMYQIARQVITEGGPVRCQDNPGEVTPGGVAADHDVIPVEPQITGIAPEMGEGASDLVDQLFKRDGRTQRVLDIGKANSRIHEGFG